MAKKSNVALWVGLFLVAGLVLYFGVIQSAVQPSVGEQIVSEQGCSVNPSIQTSVSDAITGASASADVTAMVNGKFVGGVPSALEKDAKVILLFNASNYISGVSEEITAKCGVNSVHKDLYATDDVSVEVVTSANDIAGNCLSATATCAGINQSSFTTAKVAHLKLTAPADQSTGELVIVVESDNSTELADFTLAGAGIRDGTRPSSKTFTQNNTNSLVEVFELDALKDGETADISVTMTPGSGKTVASMIVYFTIYSKQAFLDSDGTFGYGVENDDHSATKYEDTQIVGLNIV